jgi:hypothetical protein
MVEPRSYRLLNTSNNSSAPGHRRWSARPRFPQNVACGFIRLFTAHTQSGHWPALATCCVRGKGYAKAPSLLLLNSIQIIDNSEHAGSRDGI